jgi:hypothetical protein
MRLDDVLSLAVILAAGCFGMWLLFRKVELRQREQMQRNETLRILVQKFNTSEEFVGFVNSDAGRQLLTPAAQPVKPQTASVLRFVQIGIVLALIGLGMLAHAEGMANLTDINFVNQRNDLHYWGMVAVMTGVGLLIAAAVTRSLGRKWGLFDREAK